MAWLLTSYSFLLQAWLLSLQSTLSCSPVSTSVWLSPKVLWHCPAFVSNPSSYMCNQSNKSPFVSFYCVPWYFCTPHAICQPPQSHRSSLCLLRFPVLRKVGQEPIVIWCCSSRFLGKMDGSWFPRHHSFQVILLVGRSVFQEGLWPRLKVRNQAGFHSSFRNSWLAYKWCLGSCLRREGSP